MFRTAVVFFLAAAAVAVDQVSKHLVKGFMEGRGGASLELIPGFFSLVYSHNTGVAFGMFSGIQVVVLYAPVVIVAVLTVLFVKSGAGGVLKVAGMGLIMGGAMGNFADRVRIGQVYDFIDIYVGPYHWPSFNAADSFIVIGVVLFGIAMMRGEFDAE